MRRSFVITVALVLPALASTARANPFKYEGMCEASAAVALDGNVFAVANDEDNQLRIYRLGSPHAVESISLDEHLGTDKKADIEGAARVGDRVYWIASHSRNSDGEVRESRRRFFATDIVEHNGEPTVQPAELAYEHLLDDLLDEDKFAVFDLRAASERAPEAKDGLNIEGLASRPDGDVLIGFRNPIHNGRALAIPLENPGKVTEGKKAKFGDAIELDLAGRGIRSIEQVGTEYLIVAGPAANEGDFALYRWSGDADQSPVAVSTVTFDDLHPEALFTMPGSGTVHVLSDDGDLKVGGVDCKDLPETDQAFRSMDISP